MASVGLRSALRPVRTVEDVFPDRPLLCSGALAAGDWGGFPAESLCGPRDPADFLQPRVGTRTHITGSLGPPPASSWRGPPNSGTRRARAFPYVGPRTRARAPAPASAPALHTAPPAPTYRAPEQGRIRRQRGGGGAPMSLECEEPPPPDAGERPPWRPPQGRAPRVPRSLVSEPVESPQPFFGPFLSSLGFLPISPRLSVSAVSYVS